MEAVKEMKNYEFPPEMQEWIDIVEKDIYKCCEEQKLLVKHIKRCFETEDIYIDLEQLEKYLRTIERYVPFGIFPWQKFVITLHECTYHKEDGMPRWPDLFCEIGRGAGKDGMIAMESMILTSPYNGIREYDVDICANNEEQSMRPVKDLINWFEIPATTKKIKRFYKWTKEHVVCTKTQSIIKGRTNSPKGKDGMRSGIVIFNEVHQYQNYDNIDVFTTGLGKKKHPRSSIYTTNGEVREGPLDDYIDQANGILRNGDDDNGFLPFICKLDNEKDVDDAANWTMANPSLPYLPNLMVEIQKEYRKWKRNPESIASFMSRRMNISGQSKEFAAAEWKYIEATKKELPNLEGWNCSVGIDYAKSTDWVSVNFHFRKENKRFDINHSWICSQSKDLHRIKAPWRKWVKNGHITYVDDVEISPDIVAQYIYEMGKKYNIQMVGVDSYRYALLKDALAKVGISIEHGNLKLVSQLDIMKIVPVIDHYFVNEMFYWGDDPVLRWATNNTKRIPYGKRAGTDRGSFVYAKFEAKSRKTDPFMALVASIVVEEEAKEFIPLQKGTILAI